MEKNQLIVKYKKTLKRPVINTEPIIINDTDTTNNINTINTNINSPIMERKRKLEELKNKMNIILLKKIKNL